MKNWFAKLRISMALDSGRESQVKQRRSADADLCRYEAALQSLDCRLKAALVPGTVPPDLHSATMRALRAATTPKVARNQWRWLPVPATALVLGAAFWWFASRTPTDTNVPIVQPQALVAATEALDQGTELTQKAPALALAPLSTELELLNRDLEKALNFVVASVP